ncbi:rho GTPase [Culex quinquefasciatus]|uniref:Rho GTPase n=1 Tax=Culex quinquefasciatus TaxID=7176 RepID=B0W3F9_CULQU|nr:rho GTPase [Culex quinquefasciatus]|eukprot:XP_001843243.1 rho GTPase [Culex quinquefasciatus]
MEELPFLSGKVRPAVDEHDDDDASIIGKIIRARRRKMDVSVDGRPICVTLCDTAGQDALDPLRQLCYPDSDVFLLCFSVVQPESFRSVAAKWEPEIAKLRRAALLLVGTQSDLRTDRATVLKLQNEGEKPVPVSAAWDFARKIGAKYIETSSHKKERIKEVFDTAIWDVLQAREFNRKRPLWKRMLCLTCADGD